MDITYEKNRQGAWHLATIAGNRYLFMTYYYYTKAEATKLFTDYVKGATK
jgi:hypothetical protein